VAHAYNPSYSGYGGQEDRGSKAARANSSWHPILKNPSQKRPGGVAQVVQVVECLPGKYEALSSNRQKKQFGTMPLRNKADGVMLGTSVSCL
jgi:hypothetical protein